MKTISLAVFLTAALAWPGVQAADTPSNFGPTVSERLTTARAAIAAKDWSRALSELNTAVRDEPAQGLRALQAGVADRSETQRSA
jgi:hypothetical protein